ncbi:CD1A protein, partial [Bucco capensis]|nr:CD1A protein [Bucco capensis]
LQILHTTVLTNTTSAEVFGVLFLGDVPLLAVDPINWNPHFYWPWVQQASSEGDAEQILSHYKIVLRNMIRFVHEHAELAKLSYPLIVQMRGGCALYPNETIWTFLEVGEDGRDLVAFKLDRHQWEPKQSSRLAEDISKSLNGMKSITGVLEHLLSIFCRDLMVTLCSYGKADLERQEAPVATVFARTRSPAQLLLVCRVTGFYPRPISVAWLRDGQEVPPGPALNTSTILPNADLTYQLRSILAVAPGDGHSYACRVSHRSLGTRSLLIPWG